MKKFPMFTMFTKRYMDEEERQVLVSIKNGKYKTKDDLLKEDSPGLMADFGMLSMSGYCGWLQDGTLVLTPLGVEAASESD